jgi:tetratricopeptide (TPR) repeat protein
MPANEIKELRQAGKLEEALALAEQEYEVDPENIWTKRNLSWVYYDYIKKYSAASQFGEFIIWIEKIIGMNLPAGERLFFEQLCWQIGKMANDLHKNLPNDLDKQKQLFEATISFTFPKPSDSYSFLFRCLHKLMKGGDNYIQFADWWNFDNFLAKDYEKDRLENGREIMAIAEQAYIAYSKNILPKYSFDGGVIFNREKVEQFLPKISELVENYPQFQYPGYFKAKLLLSLGDKDNMLSSLLPFAKIKKNDFWVWDILAEAFPDDEEKVFACYCKALSCNGPAEMLINVRQKLARMLIGRKLYAEAKTEIELLLKLRIENGYKIPSEVANWQSADWFQNTSASKSNTAFYKEFISVAEAIIFSDIPEEVVLVEFVNTDKKILNFMASEEKYGFFKYDRFLPKVNIGDTLKVRFKSGNCGELFHLHTASIIKDEAIKNKYYKKFDAVLQKKEDQSFGFVGDVFVHPSIIKKHHLIGGTHVQGLAIKSFNREKKSWGWKVVEIEVKS